MWSFKSYFRHSIPFYRLDHNIYCRLNPESKRHQNYSRQLTPVYPRKKQRHRKIKKKQFLGKYTFKHAEFKPGMFLILRDLYAIYREPVESIADVFDVGT